MTYATVSLRASIALALGAALLPATAAAERPIREGYLLVKSAAGLPAAKLEKKLEKRGGKTERKLMRTEVRLVKVQAGKELEIASALNKDPEIAFAEPDMLVEPIAVVNDPNYGSQWHLPVMGAPTAWAYANGKGVTVAICDTGVNSNHPDLATQVVPGWNTAGNNADTSDIHGHGTWVSGVVAAAANNLIGGASVAPGARVMTMRITDRTDGYAYFSDMAECVTWAADHGARVANISFGGVPGSSTVASAASYMMSKGGLVVVAAGNDGADKGYSNSPYLFTAAATTSSDARASYSNYGSYVDIAAPGSSIYTTDRGGGYKSVSGTSFASPDAAATAALVMSANPALTPTDVLSIITNTAKDLGTAGWDPYYGFGRVDAGAAVTMAANVATSDSTAPSVAIATPTSSATVSDVVTVDVQASDDFGVTSVDFFVNGTFVATDTQEDPANPYIYRFAWDSTEVSDGPHKLTAKAKDAAGNVGSAREVSVTVANQQDTVKPTVTLSNPKSGASFTTGSSVSVSATASDNVGVANLSVYAGSKLLCSVAATSASCSWSLSGVAAGTYVISATAKDAAGNQETTSASITVTSTTTTTTTTTDCVRNKAGRCKR
jgi:subtilisin family serine protease